MKRLKPLKRVTAVVILLIFAMSITPFAWYSGKPQISTSYNYDHQREKLQHNGLVWDVITNCTKTTIRTSDNGTRYDYSDDVQVAGPPVATTTVGRINEAGNLEISTKDKPDLESGVIGSNVVSNGSSYYTMYLYGTDNPGTAFDSANMGTNNDLELKFKYQDRFQINFNAGKSSRKYYIDFFSDSKIYYEDLNGVSRALEADVAWNVWHTLKLSTRNGKTGTIYLDGKELIQYQLPNSRNSKSELMLRIYNHIENHIQSIDNEWGTPDAYFEVEYVTLKPLSSAGTTTDADTETEKTAVLSVPKTAAYGTGITASVATTNIPDISRYEYYANGSLVQSSASATATISGMRAGTAAIKAKVVCNDGTEYVTDTQYVDVNKGAIASNETINMSREYRLEYDYDGTSGSNVKVNDGYFNLNFTYGNNSITYTNNSGETETYTGAENGISGGKYKIVATAGNAEVYYNNHFLFSCLLPYTNSGTQNIEYSGGITNAKLYASGVKAERYLGEWTAADSVEAYGLDFDQLYTVEFNKTDQQSETVVVYDGTYQGKLMFDERGITALHQPEDYKIPQEFNLTDTIEPGYYRLTVAHGLAQLFVDNVYINSFKCPYNPHAKSVMRSAVSSAASRMVSVKNTDDVYYHTETFENITEYGANEYWFSELEGLAAEESESDPFTQTYEEEANGNKYIRITDTGLEKPYYAAAAEASDSDIEFSQPIGDWNLNAVADNPVVKWRAKADGTGEIHFIARHYRKYHFVSVSYDFDENRWKVNRYTQKNKSVTFEADPNDESISGNVSFTKVYYPFEEVLQTSNAASPGTGWNDYEMIVNDEEIKLFCNGTEVISYSGLAKAHGKVGFGVRNGASLCIDDVEYKGDGKATPGLSYFTLDEGGDSSYKTNPGLKTISSAFETGTRDFYKGNSTLGVVACGGNDKQYYTTDGGKTWNTMLDSEGHPSVNGPGANVLNLLSGGWMEVINASWGRPGYDEWLDAEVFDKEKGITRLTARIYPDSDKKIVLNGGWPDERIIIDPENFESYKYNASNIASQLVQVQDGPYKGRIFMTKSIGGERYGGEALFYTDVDKPFINGSDSLSNYWGYNANGVPVRTALLEDEWTASATPLTYKGIGVDFAESKVVGMPDGTVRVYGRTSNGFLYYSDSNDGGNTWSKAVPSPFISPRCSYGVACDPQNPNTYYSFWTYDTNTVYKQGDGGSPRLRTALAVSYDAMKTWQYVTDIDDSTFDWKLNHDNKTSISAIEDHGLRIIDGVVYMDYDGQGTNFTKIFTIDTAKIKPLKRFTSVHDRKVYYTDGAELLLNRVAVLPKTTGMGKLYGTDVNVEVTDGNYSTAILAKAFKTSTSEVSGLTIAQAAAQTGKNVVETDNAYIISDTELGRASVRYLEGLGIQLGFDADNKQDFLNRFNKAVEYENVERMTELLGNCADIFGESADFSNATAIEKMTGFTYYKLEDIRNIYDMICTALAKGDSDLLLSTVNNGYNDWSSINGQNAATVTYNDEAVTVSATSGYSDVGEFGTTAFEIPDCDTYILNLDVKVGSASGAKIKWGSSAGLLQIALNSDSGFIFAQKPDEIPIELTPNKWYNLAVMVEKVGECYNATVKTAEIAADESIGEYTTQTFNGVKGTTGEKGFWLEAAKGGKISAKNVRVYTDTVIEVADFLIAGNKVSATVNILNFDTVFPAGQTVMSVFNDNVFAASAYSENFTDIEPMGIKTVKFANVSFPAKMGVNPKAKFSVWKDTLNLQTIVTPLQNVSLNSGFSEDFSAAVLDSAKWKSNVPDPQTGFVGIDNGVLRMSKTTSQGIDASTRISPQSNNMVLSFDFKVDSVTIRDDATGAGTQMQIHWYGSPYTDGESQKVQRVPFYIITGSNGLIYLNRDNNYKLEPGTWYSLAIARSFDGENCNFAFYIKERGTAEYQKIWDYAGNTVAKGARDNTLYFYEGNASNFDMSIDNIKIVNGGM